MIRSIFFLLTVLYAALLVSQEEKIMPPTIKDDTLGKAPDYDAEMRVFDKFGYLYTNNALKLSPVLSQGNIEGVNMVFEKGGIGKKFSMNFLLGYFSGVLHYGKKMENINGETAIVTDSSLILFATPQNFRFELQPRFYMFENFGVFLGPSFGFHSTSIDKKPVILGGVSSGIAFKWKNLLLDNSIGIFYDPVGYGVEDFDVSMRISINIGFYWHTKGSEVEEFE